MNARDASGPNINIKCARGPIHT
jgi:hypothetical protein